MLAAGGSHFAVVRFLVEKGLDVHAIDSSGNTAIHFAVRNDTEDSLKIVEYLSEKGANLNKKNLFGQSPLMAAARDGSLRAARFLINDGGPVNDQDDEGRTPLHFACFGAPPPTKAKIVELLLAAGAMIKAKDNDGRTPLMVASNVPDMATVQLLLDHGAEINAVNYAGWSCLMYAARSGQIPLINMLAERGANIGLKNSDGMTAAMIAKKLGHIDAYDLLKKLERED
jgi:ankyrin repeat protein